MVNTIYQYNVHSQPNINQIKSNISTGITAASLINISYKFDSTNTTSTPYETTIIFNGEITSANQTSLENFLSIPPLKDSLFILSTNGTFGNEIVLNCNPNNSNLTITIPSLTDTLINTKSIQSLANKIIDGNCNTITNINFGGVLPVLKGGTGITTTTGALIGDGTNPITSQTLSGVIIDSASVQFLENKIIDGNCNTITNINIDNNS